VGTPCRSRLPTGHVEREAHVGEGLLAGLVTHGGLALELPVLGGLALEQFVENCLLWEGPYTGAGAGYEESSP